MKKNIVLIGYMASGKTVVGKILADRLSFEFIDLDAYIEFKTDLSISSIFKTKGEVYFRKIERQYLSEIIEYQSNYILALGGGTPCYGNNMALINKKTTSVFLRTPLPVLVKRLKQEKLHRPLVAQLNDADLNEFVAKHLFERNPFYNQSAISIDIDEADSPQRVVDMIQRNLKDR